MRTNKLVFFVLLLTSGFLGTCQSKIPNESNTPNASNNLTEHTIDTEKASNNTSNPSALSSTGQNDSISPLDALYSQIKLNNKNQLLFKSDDNLILVQKDSEGAEERLLFYDREAELVSEVVISSYEPFDFIKEGIVIDKEGSHYFLEFDGNGEEVLSQLFSKKELSTLYTSKLYYSRSVYFHNGVTVLSFNVCPTVNSNEEYEPFQCKRKQFVFDSAGKLVDDFLLPLNAEYFPNEYSEGRYAGSLYPSRNDLFLNCFTVVDVQTENVIYTYCNDQETFTLGPTFLSKDVFFVFSRTSAEYHKSRESKGSTVFVCRLIDLKKKVEYKKVLDFTVMPEKLSGDTFYYRTDGKVHSFSLNKDFLTSPTTFIEKAI